MRRILWCIILITVNLVSFLENDMLCLAEETETTIENNDLYARSAVLMDADSGRILFDKEGETPLPMASTTKIMTCILTLENGNLQELVEVSDYAASMPDVQLNMKKGEYYLLEDLLYSLMLESHNDSAVAIAEHIGGSVEGFAVMMNEKAKEIGCKNTCFLTPNGLDAKKEITLGDGSKETVVHSTTAADLALIMSYCIKKSPKREEFLKITETKSYSFHNKRPAENGVSEGGRSFSCNNHNAFLTMMEGAISGKTGFTGSAGYCYVGALERDGRTFVVSLLACGWPNNKRYKWSDTRKLMEYGIANYRKVDLSGEEVKKEWLAEIPVSGARTDVLYGEASAALYIRDEAGAPVFLMKEGEKAEVLCEVKNHLAAPVEKDQQVGSIQYRVDGKVVWERKICTKEEILKVDFLWYVKMLLMDYFV